MKKIVTAVFAAGAILSGHALAHGAKPAHGGIVQSAGDLAFELVAREEGTVIYVGDHGKDKPTAGASGILTVLQGTSKTEFALAPGGNNTLVVKGNAQLKKGSKAVAAVTFADSKAVSVRFAIR